MEKYIILRDEKRLKLSKMSKFLKLFYKCNAVSVKFPKGNIPWLKLLLNSCPQGLSVARTISNNENNIDNINNMKIFALQILKYSNLQKL